MIILCRGLVRSEGGSHQMLPACAQICHLLAISHHCVHWRDIAAGEHTLEGLAFESALFELMSTYSHVQICNMCRHRQSDDAVSACDQHGCQARSPDGCGFTIPLQWSLDIINVLCVWPNNDPLLIQMQVTRADESLRSDILKDLRRLLLCLCKGTFWHWRKSPARLRNGTKI